MCSAENSSRLYSEPFLIERGSIAASFCEKCPHEWFHLTLGKAECECEVRMIPSALCLERSE